MMVTTPTAADRGSCAIVIRTYWKDLDWLALCLRSIERFCHGFSEVVVAVPETSRAWLARAPVTSGVRVVQVPSVADDYLGQQVTKLTADELVGADFIAHVDADCIFTRPTHADEFVAGGRPRVATRPITALGRHYPWRAATEAFLGFPVDLDYMQRPPFVFPRGLYGKVRRHARQLHNEAIDRYVLRQPPRGFSEFNVLGAFAHRCAAGSVAVLPVEAAPPPCCEWHWSWGGLSPSLRRRIEALLDDQGACGSP